MLYSFSWNDFTFNFWRRKGEPKKDEESAHQNAASPQTVDETADQSPEVTERRDHRRGKYESVLVIDNKVVYTKVDKSNKDRFKLDEENTVDESISDSGLENIDDEDITMFENTDLYDTAGDDKNNHDDDSNSLNSHSERNYDNVVIDNTNNDCDSDSLVIYENGEVCSLSMELTGDSNDITPKLGNIFEDCD